MNRVDHTVRKAVFMFFQIFAYAFRPMCIKPNLVPVDRWIVLNWAVQLTFDGLFLSTPIFVPSAPLRLMHNIATHGHVFH